MTTCDHSIHQATLMLFDMPGEAEYLKKLALFFDKIYYIRPLHRVIDAIEFRNKSVIFHADGWHLNEETRSFNFPSDFNYFRDTRYALEFVTFKNQELQETVDAFEKAGVIEATTDWPTKPLFSKDILDELTKLDICDPGFLSIFNTSFEQANRLPAEIHPLHLQDGENQFGFAILNPPQSIQYSFYANYCLLYASELSSSPIFLDPLLRKQMEWKYNNFLQGLSLLAERLKFPVEQFELQSHFGEMVFLLTDELLSTENIADAKLDDILKLRDDLQESRRRFLSLDLAELAYMLEEQSWDPNMSSHIRKFVNTKLKKDIQTFNDKTVEAWEKLVGKLIVTGSEVVRDAAFGAGAGGIAISVVPNASPWELVAISAIAMAFRKLPDLFKVLVDLSLEKRKQCRSSMAYIASLKGYLRLGTDVDSP